MLRKNFTPEIIDEPTKPPEPPREIPDPKNPQPPDTPFPDHPEKNPAEAPPHKTTNVPLKA
jgi:hypothetical protein